MKNIIQKAIFLILIPIFLISGCSSKEKELEKKIDEGSKM